MGLKGPVALTNTWYEPQRNVRRCLGALAFELPTINNDNLLTRTSRRTTNAFNRLYHIHSFNDFSKDNVFAIQPGVLGGR